MSPASGASHHSSSAEAGLDDDAALRDVLALARDHLAAAAVLFARCADGDWQGCAGDPPLDAPLDGPSPALERMRQTKAPVLIDAIEPGADALGRLLPEGAAVVGVALPDDPDRVLVCARAHPPWTPDDADTLQRYGRLVQSQQASEAARAQAERRLRWVTEGYPFGAIALFDRDLRYVRVGGQGFGPTDLDPGAMEGRAIQEVLPPDLVAQIEPQYRRALAGEVVKKEVVLAGRTYRTTAAPVRDEGGAITHGLVTTLDVTERRETEEQLRLHQTALDQAHEGVVILEAASSDEEGRRIAYVNEAFEAMTGYAADEVVGGSLQILKGPETDPEALRRIKEAFASTEAVQEQLLNYRKDGTPFWAEVAIAPVRDAGGEHTYWISIQRDITDRVEAQRALRASEERWRRLVDEHPNPTYITVGGIFRYLNPSAVAIFGADAAEELLGRSVFDFAHPEVDAAMQERLARLEAGSPTEPLQHRMHRLDGAERIVVTQSVPVTYAGEAAVQTVLRDVTEQKRAAAALREREKQLASILDNMPSGVVIVEAPSGEVIRYNRAAEDLLGHPIRAGGRAQYDAYHARHPDGTPYAADEYPTARALDGQTVAQEEMVYPQGGEPNHLLVNAAPIRDEDGAIVAAVCTYQDISQLKDIQQALRRSKERFQAVSEQAIDVIAVVGRRGTFRYLSASFESVTGLSRGEMLGTNAFDRVHPADREKGLAALNEVRADPEATVNVDLRYRHRDGAWRHLSVRAGQLWTPNGATEVLLNVRDNTEQHRYEELLEERRRRLELALAGGDLGMWDWDMNADAVTYNDRWGAMLGYTPDEVEPTVDFFRERVHPDDLERVFAALGRHARGEIPRLDLEIRMRAKDGSWRWVLDRGQIVAWNEDGTPKRAVGTHMDITERKEAEAELRRSKTYAERLIGAMQDGFSVVDAEGTQVQVNDAFCRMTGFSEDELLGATPPYPYWPDEGQDAVRAAFNEAMKGREGDVELTFRRKSGEHFPVLLSPTRLLDEDGQTRYGLATVKDISVRKRYEEGLIEAKREAEAARDRAEEMNRLKSAFLANMSHEIRTPLTSMLGFTEVLEGMDLEPPAARFARLIHRGGDRLLETLNSVLDLSQLEAGAMTLRPVPLRVCAEVRDIVQGFEPRADEAEVALTIEVPDDPVRVTTDRGALQRIVSNLVGNAIKFTEPGGTVTVRVDPHPERLRLIVDDTGVGIDEAFLPHLFEAFQQESTGDARAFEGSGLGLSITKQLVDMLDGTIAVDSVKGEGTTVTVEVPGGAPASE